MMYVLSAVRDIGILSLHFQGMMYVYYNTSEKERCHSYRVDGDVPKHFWKGHLLDGTGMCGNQQVTFWYFLCYYSSVQK